MFTINSTELIAACGLYCGACRKYKRGKCQGCSPQADGTAEHRSTDNWLHKCRIRRCVQEKAYHTCAECETDVKECKHHNTFINRLVSMMFNSDRAACIRYIKHNGEERYAEKMSWNEQMTFRKKK